MPGCEKVKNWCVQTLNIEVRNYADHFHFDLYVLLDWWVRSVIKLSWVQNVSCNHTTLQCVCLVTSCPGLYNIIVHSCLAQSNTLGTHYQLYSKHSHTYHHHMQCYGIHQGQATLNCLT